MFFWQVQVQVKSDENGSGMIVLKTPCIGRVPGLAFDIHLTSVYLEFTDPIDQEELVSIDVIRSCNYLEKFAIKF